MTKMQDIKLKIQDLKITMDEAITIQVLNFLAFFFIQFLDTLSYKARKKDKLLILENLAKFLKVKKLQIKNHHKTMANYT